MIMAGWCCCSYWEEWDQWQPADYTIAGESLRTQMRRLRNHASALVFLYGSDNAPPPQAEQVYLNVLAEENWPNPYLNSASDHTTPGAGRSGVKMTGPYDYVAPSYWLLDTQRGGAWGFITETSPGPAIPVAGQPPTNDAAAATSGRSAIPRGIFTPAAAASRRPTISPPRWTAATARRRTCATMP